MAPGSYTIWRSLCVNLCVNFTKQDKLAGTQDGRSDANNDKALISLKAPTPPLILSSAEDLFTKFMKVFIETTQAQALAEPQERTLKARTPEIYWGKSHMECYHFCQQCEDHFETLGATGINRTLFAASFFCNFISFRWAQHKRRHKSTTPIIWPKFKAFLQKDLKSS